MSEGYTAWGSLGRQTLHWSLEQQALVGDVPGWGALNLQQVDACSFESEPAPDSAGEFQVRLTWAHSQDHWTWTFQSGLPGTLAKGVASRWTLRRTND